MAQHNELGVKGEQIALQFLKNKDYKIIETNWRYEKDEVDIIAFDRDELVIIEVKTRSTSYFGDPSEAVDTTKEKNMIRAAEAYLELNNLDVDTRFDIISIVTNKSTTNIEHIKDAFYPEIPD